MKSNYRKIVDYIREVKNRNSDGKTNTLLGINIDKYFMPSVANIVGTDLTNYKIVKKNQFACNRMHVGRDKRLPVALSKIEDDFIVSPAYNVFEIIDEGILSPEYLMMWFSRNEFDRNVWFYTDADVRGGLSWSAFCNMDLPVPDIEKQKAIVKEYNTIVNRIKLNEKLNKKLEETAQAIFKQWFVDFEFPCLPQDYRPSGQVNLNELNKVCTYKRVGGLPVPDGKSWFVYVLLCIPSSADEQVSENNLPVHEVNAGSFYKGITNDLYLRFYEHYTGQRADWTKVRKPVKVIHYEQFDTQEKAAKREKELKSGYARTWLQRQYKKLITGSPAPECQLRKAGEMAWNGELDKEIPKGWEVGPLSNIATILMGQSPKGESYNTITEGIIFYQGRTDFGFRYPDISTYTTSPKRMAKENNILLSVRAPVGDLNIATYDCCIGRGLATLESKLGCNSYLFYLMQLLKNKFSISNDDGTVFGSIGKDDLNGLSVLLVDNTIIKSFEKIAKPIDKNIKAYSFQKKQLERFTRILLAKMSKI